MQSALSKTSPRIPTPRKMIQLQKTSPPSILITCISGFVMSIEVCVVKTGMTVLPNMKLTFLAEWYKKSLRVGGVMELMKFQSIRL